MRGGFTRPEGAQRGSGRHMRRHVSERTPRVGTLHAAVSGDSGPLRRQLERLGSVNARQLWRMQQNLSRPKERRR